MARKPKEITNNLLAASSRARGAIDDIVQSGEFMNSFLAELRKEAPGRLAKLIDGNCFFLTREKNGYELHLKNKDFPGKILAIFSLGTPAEYPIPKLGSGQKLISMPNVVDKVSGVQGIVRYSPSKDGEAVMHPRIIPDKFIYRAWHRTLNKYTMRVKRAIEQGFRGN
jgi:hypothetical protein